MFGCCCDYCVLSSHPGFQCEEHDNPADFFLDVVTQCENENNKTCIGTCCILCCCNYIQWLIVPTDKPNKASDGILFHN